MEELAERWELTEIGEASDGGSTSFVAPARGRDGRHFALKVMPVGDRLETERLALEHWRGSGAVTVEAAAPELGAILLQWAEPGTPLATAGLDEDEEGRIFCEVVRRLQSVSGPRNASAREVPRLPLISSWLDALRPSGPHEPPRSPEPVRLPATRRTALEVAEPLLNGAERTVLHGDLHHENILAVGRDRWVAIDPKGVLGPPEAEAAAFLRNPRERLLASDDPVSVLTHRVSLISSRLGFDAARISGWAFVLAVVASVWALEDEGAAEAEAWLRCAFALQAVHETPGGLSV